MSDSDPRHISAKAKDNYFKFYPAGTSFNCIEHFRQMMISGKFCRFDNGEDYDLSKIKETTKITLICGKHDLLSSQQDYMWLLATL